MPRAVVYGQRPSRAGHLDALLASELAQPAPARMHDLETRADQLAARVSPEAVQPLYLARLAQEPNALQSPDKADWWMEAADKAAAGVPAPDAAVKLTSAGVGSALSSKDGFLEKIAKYAPAESITVTLLAFAALTPTGSDVWWLVAAGAIANVLYLFGTALAARANTPMPRWYFYPLSAAALVLWSIAVVEVVGQEAGTGGGNAEAQKTFVIAAGAFFIPLIDEIATGLTEQVEEAKTRRQAGKP